MTSQNIDSLYQKTKGQLFFQKNSGFLGSLLARMSFKWDSTLPTAAVSDKTLYWNPEFFESLDPQTRVTVLAHEIWHKALLHGARLNDRCPEIWNIAGDHVINLLLKEHGYYMDGFPYVMDDKYKGWSTDDVYDDLIKPGKPRPQAGQIPGLGADVLPIDADKVHGAVADVVGAQAAAGFSPGNNPGDIPGEISMVIDEFLNPRLPWETLLFNFFNEMTCDEFSYARPNRRYYDPMLPGKMGRNGLEHLIYYQDISGSIQDEEIVMFNSELKFVQEQLNPERLTAVTFDTVIHDIFEFERDEPYEKIEITGRGGTNLTEVFEHAMKHKPTAIVIFTDLEVSIPPNPGMPVLWVVSGNPKAKVPYGQLIHVDL